MEPAMVSIVHEKTNGRKGKKKRATGIPVAPVTLSRFELLTFRLGGGRSIQLSYRIKCIKA